MRSFLLCLFFLITLNLSGQEPCDPNERFCMGACREARLCARGGPPPPGLVVPIDTNISFLLAAGLGLGIFYFGFCRAKASLEKGSTNN